MLVLGPKLAKPIFPRMHCPETLPWYVLYFTKNFWEDDWTLFFALLCVSDDESWGHNILHPKNSICLKCTDTCRCIWAMYCHVHLSHLSNERPYIKHSVTREFWSWSWWYCRCPISCWLKSVQHNYPIFSIYLWRVKLTKTCGDLEPRFAGKWCWV